MPIPVSDTGANYEETIERAAKLIRRSKLRRAVFCEIYRGKRNPKTVAHIAHATKLSRYRVLTEGRKLVAAQIVGQVKVNGQTAYEKVEFYQHERNKIIRLAENPAKLAKISTKRRPAAVSNSRAVQISFRASPRRIRAKHIAVDAISAFSKVRRIESAPRQRIPEARFKAGVARLLCEQGRFQDWGGESNDLSTNRLRLGGKRREAVFAFKGPGTKGKLTLAKMGKNGDQVLRLVRSHAEVFVVQYWRQIDEAVRTELYMLAAAKSIMEDKQVWYCVIDGQDTDRLIAAYPRAFEGDRGRRR